MLHRIRFAPSRRQRGQAIVELALSITFIMFLLSAAIDLGLAYKTYQSLVNATAEASSYLSQNPLAGAGTPAQRRANANNIAINNFRFETGEDGRVRSIGSMRDLNANGKDDLGTGGAGDGMTAATLQSGGWIVIDETTDASFSNSFNINNYTPSTVCANRMRYEPSTGNRCYVVVKAQIIYKPFFALAPVIGDEVRIRAYSVKPISS